MDRKVLIYFPQIFASESIDFDEFDCRLDSDVEY
jgi:hypothetical protein